MLKIVDLPGWRQPTLVFDKGGTVQRIIPTETRIVVKTFTHEEVAEAEGEPELELVGWIKKNAKGRWHKGSPNWSWVVWPDGYPPSYSCYHQPMIAFHFEREEDAALFKLFWC